MDSKDKSVGGAKRPTTSTSRGALLSSIKQGVSLAKAAPVSQSRE